ncbi:MAG TPA: dTMP kinase [Terriglobales bacterium]|nr:dTMP kinase [Terriglobales bacterium]
MIRKTTANRAPLLVSFSGIDGAGKSTQIEALHARLGEAGIRVLVVTFWNDVARLTRIREVSGHTLFRGDKGVGTPASPVNRQDKNVQSWYMTAVRFGLYLMDATSLRVVVAKALRADADVVIFDRYLYDELANLSSQNRIARAYVRLLLMLVPQPDISYLLDVDPVQARDRKPEYPIDFLHRSRASYLALSKLAGMTIIAPQSVQDVERQILQQVLRMLSPDALQDSSAEVLTCGDAP